MAPTALSWCLLLALALSLPLSLAWRLVSPHQRSVPGDRALVFYSGCLEEKWQEQPLDHFRFSEKRTYKQRYFICNKYFTSGGPIFFYAGNEAGCHGVSSGEDLESRYVNATGLMWENAHAFGAMLVFAEHRYYGTSQPFGKDSWKVDPAFLTTEQAVADFANLVHTLKAKLGVPNSAVIAFGGSYGGMLAAWLRMKHPLLFQGAIAASAPIGAFPGSSVFKPSKFWEVVTRDATPAGGAPDGCADDVRAGFKALFELGAAGHEGRDRLRALLRLCDPLDSAGDVRNAAYWVQGAFDAYAMGNYPFESSYITGDPSAPLPAWPMRAACNRIAFTIDALHRPEAAGESSGSSLKRAMGGSRRSAADTGVVASRLAVPKAGQLVQWTRQVPIQEAVREAVQAPVPPEVLVEALREAAALMYNASGTARCFALDTSGPAAGNSGPWDYQFCTELCGQEQPYYPTTGVSDMFWDQGPFDLAGINRHCMDTWKVMPRVHHSFVMYGGVEAAPLSSNIVFSNGLLDPWSVFGVLNSFPSNPSIVVVTIPNGAHHVDLMFSHPDDTHDIIAARKTELDAIRDWIRQYGAAQQGSTP